MLNGFISCHRDGIGEIQAADIGVHRDSHGRRRVFMPQAVGQSPGFAPKNEEVAGRITDVRVELLGGLREQERVMRWQVGTQVVEAGDVFPAKMLRH